VLVKWKPYSVLIFLVLLIGLQILYYTFFAETTIYGTVIITPVLSEKVVYSCYALAAIVALAIVIKGPYWKYGLLIYLACYFFGIVQISELIFSFSINDMHIKLLPLVLIALHTYVNPGLLQALMGRPSSYEDIELSPRDNTPLPEKIAFFEKKFESKSTEDLEHNIELNELVEEAIIASRNLLEKRK
jgi:hypothetical protein